MTLASSSTITVTAGSFTEGGAINGDSAGLTKKGNGTLVLGGFGNFNGGFTASGGSVNATLSNALGSGTGTITVDSSSTLNLGSTTQSASVFVLGGASSSGNVFGGTISAGTFTLLSGQMNSKLSDGPSGLGSLTKSGTGTAVLSGSMSYTGQTTVSAGGLNFTRAVIALGSVANDGFLSFTASGTSSTMSNTASNVSGTASSGTSKIVVSDSSNLLRGMILRGGSADSFAPNTRILAVTGNTLTLSTPLTNVLSSGTALYADVSSGTSQIVVSSASNLLPGMILTGGSSNSIAPNTRILAVTGNTLTLSSPLTDVLSSGTALYADASISLSSLSGAGTTQFSSNATLGTLTGGSSSAINAVGTLFVSSGSFSGGLVGATSLEKVGSGSLLTLSGTSANTGSTKVSAGTLRSTIPGALSATSSLSVVGGLLDVVDYNPNITLSVGSLGTATVSLSSGTLNGALDNAGSLTFTGNSLTLNGGANNAGSLNFTSTSGTVTLGSLKGAGTTYFASNAKIIGGSISEGVVIAEGSATLYATVAGGSVTTGALNIDNGTLYGGTITLKAGTSVIHTFSGGGSLTIGSLASLQVYNGSLSGIAGGGTVVKVGSFDSLTFAGGTSFTGTMSVVAGTLKADSFGTSALLNVGTYGIATISGTSNISLGSVINAGSVNFSGTSGTVTLGSLDGVGITRFLSNGSISAELKSGNVTVDGTLTLGTFSGGILTVGQLNADFIRGGSLTITSGTSIIGLISEGTLTNKATLQVHSGTIKTEIGGDGILLKVNSPDTLSETVDVLAGKLPQIKKVIILAGTLNAVDFGTLTATNLDVGTSGIGVISGTGISIGNVWNVGSLTFSGGTVSLTSLSGSGITTFANEAAISGTLSDGTVSVTGAFSAGVLSGGSVTLLSNGTIGLLNGGLLSSDSALVITGSGGTALATGTGGTVLQGALSLEKRGSGTVSLAAVNTYTGGTTLTDGTLNLNNAAALGGGSFSGGSFSIAGGALNNTSGAAVRLNDHLETWNDDFRFLGTNDLNLGAGTFTLAGLKKLTVDAGTLTVAGIISGGSDGFTKEGNGALVLSGSAAFTGGTNVNGGLLLLGGSSALAGATLTVSAGSVDLGGNTQAVGNVSLLAGGYIGNGTLASSGSVSVDSGVIAAVISGSSVVTKSGTGSAFLSKANDYKGGTVINGGTLNIDDVHAIGDGTLSLASGGGLGTTVAAGITLSTSNAQIWSGSFSFSGYTLD
ncbi:MAG: autotransporter-associated beta strand repeat-containing protein, partial [Verrucomicrobiota bacterium]